MMRRVAKLSATVASAVLLLGLSAARAQDVDVNELLEKAMKDAAAKVAPSVVLIETTGGTEIIGRGPRGQLVRKGVGPTTGVIVSPDGYIISSAFNFANKPSAIFVAVPGEKERKVATIVATDRTRMLTLLKIDAKDLPVPPATPKNDIRVGQWSLALGRTLNPDVNEPPSISKGIISALNRIWGKAVQTDAKVSPVNYGGPLVDIQGRVMGILVPASPQAQDETAGIEWYDSGIGFAIPLEDVMAALPRLKQGQDLNRGLLGISLQSGDIYGAAPVIGSVAPESAAAKAGIKQGDVIVEIDGQPVVRQAQILHILGPKYEGDTVSVKIKRGDEIINLPNLQLTGTTTAFAHGFMGIVPLRDDPEVGVGVRYVFPKSAADIAGIKEGDRIMKVGPTQGNAPLRPFSGRDQLQAILNQARSGTAIQVEVQRSEGKTETVTLTLGDVSTAVPAQLPEKRSLAKALEPRKQPGAKPMPPKKEEEKKEEEKKPETGLLQRSNAARDQEYWLYVPDNYDPNIAHALVIWLHPANKFKDADTFVNTWKQYCEDRHIIAIGPQSTNEDGWLPSESDFIRGAAREVMEQYTVDPQRVVVHGMGLGGQMAYYLGFQDRSLIRGVAVTGAVLTRDPKENVATQRLAFFVVAGGKDPLAKDIADSRDKLAAEKFPVTYREIPEMGHQYLDRPTLEELVRWIDSLDRL
ncbi:MAG: trypsin-like peptidase domain-containing protein [Gemmataceae bacterium]